MMNIKHARKAETFFIDDLQITVEAYGKTYQGNPAGFSVKIRGTEAHYHLNVLDINEAIFRGLHKYLQRELGLAPTTTFMNVHLPTRKLPPTMWIHAEDGRFGFSTMPGRIFNLREISFDRTPTATRVWKIWQGTIEGQEEVGKVVRFGESENDDRYHAYTGDYFEADKKRYFSERDAYMAAAKLILSQEK